MSAWILCEAILLEVIVPSRIKSPVMKPVAKFDVVKVPAAKFDAVNVPGCSLSGVMVPFIIC